MKEKNNQIVTILKVLKRFSDTQINIASEQARKILAYEIDKELSKNSWQHQKINLLLLTWAMIKL